MQSNKSYNKPNSLINAKSPYLLQHAYNPVNWEIWCEDALLKAKELNKPILVSIGYSSCHWCHVMEKESFVDNEIAQIMNENFINIKVDREERPDIDHLYMEAVQLITGNGGWPLNCFLLPDTRPFWGGTYFPKESWKEILLQISEIYKKSPERLIKQADLIQQNSLKIQNNFSSFSRKTETNLNPDKAYRTISNYFDNIKGGIKGAPKFPMPVVYDFLLTYSFFKNNNNALEHISQTLELMANGGIYDQLGGGFFRYSTDNDWKVPHFEKMLYDNAQLISLYSNTFKVTQNNFFKEIAEETIFFLENELKSENGLYYSAIDADSEGEEGKYYIWKGKEIEEFLGDDAILFKYFFQVDGYSKWEKEYNILIPSKNPEMVADKFKLTISELKEKINISKKTLFNRRKNRIRPLTDTKVLLSWNALVISCYIDAYNAFNNENYYLTAKNSALKIIEIYNDNNQELKHILNYNQEENLAFLDDYSFFIEALINLYQTDADEYWLETALKLTQEAFIKFKKQNDELLFFSDVKLNKLYQNYKEITDIVIPSANSTFMLNLFKLGTITDNSEYKNTAVNALNLLSDKIDTNPLYYSKWIKLLLMVENDFFTLRIEGKNSKEYLKKLNKMFIPNLLLMPNISNTKDNQENTIIYLCNKNYCFEPMTDIDKCVEIIKKQ
jgi:hypothetical protein